MTKLDGPVAVTGAGGSISGQIVARVVPRGHAARAFVLYNSRGERSMLDQADRARFERIARDGPLRA
jgi:hypothetical protein